MYATTTQLLQVNTKEIMFNMLLCINIWFKQWGYYNLHARDDKLLSDALNNPSFIMMDDKQVISNNLPWHNCT